MKTLFLFPLFFLGFASIANAGFFFEPEVGYAWTTYNSKNTANEDAGGKGEGARYGATAGYRFNRFLLGLGYAQESHRFLLNAGYTPSESDVKFAVTKLSLGLMASNRVKLLVEYGINPELHWVLLGEDQRFSAGSYVSFSVGFLIYSHLSVNLFAAMNSPKKFKTDYGSTEVGDSSSGLNTFSSTSYGASISFPFGLTTSGK